MNRSRTPRSGRSTPRSTAPSPVAARGGRNFVRIIGGRWRALRIHFPTTVALRPTPDRVRETVFNWLQSALPGAKCLDLFAGSGVLGIEALSRGAAEVVLVDRDTAVVKHLIVTLAQLKAEHATVEQNDALRYLLGPSHAFDVVFLDPPFADQSLSETCRLLTDRGWLAVGAHIYLERPAIDGAPVLPPTWSLIRAKQAGQVGYYLARAS